MGSNLFLFIKRDIEKTALYLYTYFFKNVSPHRHIVLGLTQKYLDELTYELIGAAIEVHKIMGRGLLESVYHECLKEELLHRKINFLSELKIPVEYRNKRLAIDFIAIAYT